MPTAQEHPALAAWTPEPPPPPQRRFAPGLIAGLLALLLVFGMIGVVAARQRGGAGAGAGSPEAAATGLLGALDRDTLDGAALRRAARYLTGEERLLVMTYADRIASLAAKPPPGAGAFALGGVGAHDVRFQRVDGGEGVAVLEVVAGTVSVRVNGARMELSLDEARRRLFVETGSRMSSLRVITVRSDGRWYVALLPTGLEWSRLANGGGRADYDRLADAAVPGQSSPEEAVRALLAALDHPPTEIAQRLAPAERNTVDAFLPAAPAGEIAESLPGLSTVERLRAAGVAGAERVADGVARVRLGGGRGVPTEVIAVQSDGTWYPSMVFTLVDLALTTAERERS